MIVLAILALFAVMALPRLGAALLRSKTDAVFDQVHRNLAYARSRAVATGLRHFVQVDTQNGELLVEAFRPETLDNATAATALQTEPQYAVREPLSPDVQITEWSVSPLGYELGTGGTAQQAQTDGAPVTFYPEGNADGARIVLEDEAGSRRGLLVDAYTGEIRELTPEELE